MRPFKCNIPKKPKLLDHLQALAQTTKFMQEINLFTPIRGKHYLEYNLRKIISIKQGIIFPLKKYSHTRQEELIVYNLNIDDNSYIDMIHFKESKTQTLFFRLHGFTLNTHSSMVSTSQVGYLVCDQGEDRRIGKPLLEQTVPSNKGHALFKEI